MTILMPNVAVRTFWIAAKVCWVAGFLYLPFLLITYFGLIPVNPDRIVWRDAYIAWVALMILVPLTAPWLWLRDQVRLRYTSAPVRLNAYLIDVALSFLGPAVFLFAIPVGYRISGVEPMGVDLRWIPDNKWPFLMIAGTGLFLTGSYITWWFSLLNRGQTPGKFIMKIRAVDAVTGAPLTVWKMFVREFILKVLLMGFHSGFQNFVAMTVLLLFLGETDIGDAALVSLLVLTWLGSMYMVVVTPFVSIFDAAWSFFGRDGDQTLHDRIVGSHVVNICPYPGARTDQPVRKRIWTKGAGNFLMLVVIVGGCSVLGLSAGVVISGGAEAEIGLFTGLAIGGILFFAVARLWGERQ